MVYYLMQKKNITVSPCKIFKDMIVLYESMWIYCHENNNNNNTSIENITLNSCVSHDQVLVNVLWNN